LGYERAVLCVPDSIDAADQTGFADARGTQERYLFLNHREGSPLRGDYISLDYAVVA
jgi:hypothetical protein